MQASRRHAFAVLLATGFALAVSHGIAQSPPRSPPSESAFPNKPIRLVAATTAGSQPDSLARLIGQKLSESWGRPVVIDNRPSAGGTIAAITVAKAAPDGHTLLYALPNFAISAVMQPSLPYDPLKDFAGVTQIGVSTNALVVSSALGVRTVKDLVALAHAQPGKLIFASGATGTAGHLSGARFNLITGIKVVHVAFKGGPDATIEVLAGRAHYHVSTLGVAMPFIKEGKLLALALTAPQRTAALPDVPALGETLPEFKRPETSHGFLAPAATPRRILVQIGNEVARILDLPDVKERLQTIGFVPAPGSPQEYNDILRTQIETLSKLVADAGLKPR